MQRRDYLKLAEAFKSGKIALDVLLKSGRTIGPALAVNLVAQHVADNLGKDNPNFDRDLFLRNAGVIVPTAH